MATFSVRTVGVFAALALLAGRMPAQQAVRLEERFAAGYLYHVSTRVDLSGSLALPPDKGQTAVRSLPVVGESAVEYDERVLAAADGGVRKTIRLYRRVDFNRKVGSEVQQNTVRPAVRRMVILRTGRLQAPFSPDGPLTWGEIDLVRTDVFAPALGGLLPDRPVRVGDRWTASTAAVQELTDLEKVEDGRLECQLEQSLTLGGRRHVRVGLTGRVRGVNEDGPNRQELDGYCFFDLESNHLSYLSLKGVHVLLDKDGKEMGRVEGQFVLSRQLQQQNRELADEALHGLALEPDADNTQLLYDNPALGVRFLYPRRWRVGGVRGGQVAVDEAEGSGLLLTLEPPDRLPSGAQYLAESRDYLAQQGAKIVRAVGPDQPAAGLEHFELHVEVMGRPAVMGYYVVRQALGGATVAANLRPADAANLRKEVERIARSVSVTRTPAAEARK